MFGQAAQFLASALPWPAPGSWTDTPPWFVNIHWKAELEDGDKKRLIFPGRACTTVEQAVNQIQYRLAQHGGTDIYVCMSGQRDGKEKLDRRGRRYWAAKRALTGALWLKSIWIDVDVKDKGFKDTAEAAEAFAKFRIAAGLPPASYVVQSGSGGFHVHWVLSEPIPVDRWLRLSGQLVAAMQSLGFAPIDYGVSIDAARLLRVPETFNFKTNPAKPTFLLVARGEYRPEYLEEILQPFHALPAARPALLTSKSTSLGPQFGTMPASARNTAINSGALSAGIQRSTIEIGDVASVCPLVAAAMTDGGRDHSQPLWHALAALSVHIVDGRDALHEMSEAHPGYVEAETDALYDRVEADHRFKDTGWTTCAHFERSGSLQCLQCEHRLEGKSPLNFVQRYIPGPPPPPGQTNGSIDLKWSTMFKADLPEGYAENLEHFVTTEVTDKDGALHRVLVFEHPIIKPWLQVGEPGKGEDAINFETEIGMRSWPVRLPVNCLGSATTFHQALAHRCIPSDNKHARSFFMAFVADLRKRKTNAPKVEPLGWSYEEGKPAGFNYGGVRYNCKGDMPSPVKDLAMRYEPVGSAKPWQEISNALIGSSPQFDAIVAEAFAGPLVKFTSHSCLIMSAYSTESGHGKTTAQIVGQTVWGHPKEMLLMNDTPNKIINRMGVLNNVPAFFDEAQTGDVNDRKWLQMAFNFTQGRDKGRLGRNSQPLQLQDWNNVMCCTGNKSLVAHLNELNRNTPAAMMRIFEFIYPRPAARLAITDVTQMQAELEHNYGWAGARYAKFLGQNGEKIQQQVIEWERTLFARFNIQQEERFWGDTIVLNLLGATYANELGLVNIDTRRLRDFFASELAKLRGGKVNDTINFANPENVAALLSNSLLSVPTRVLITENWDEEVGKPGETTPINWMQIQYNRDRWVARYARNQRILLVDKVVLRELINDQGITPTTAMKSFEKVLGAVPVKVTLTKGTKHHGIQTNALKFNCNSGPLQDLYD